MKTSMFTILSLLAVMALVAGCKSDVTGEYVQNGNSSLRLFEESSGTLFDVKNGEMTVEAEASSLNPLSDSLTLRLKSSGRTYLIRIKKSKIAADGSFSLDETELEQPIRITGRLKTNLAECSFANLINSEKVDVELKIFKGFSGIESPIGFFKTEIKFEVGQKQAKL